MSDVDLSLDPESSATATAAWQAMRRDVITILRPRLLSDGGGARYADPAGPLTIGPLAATFWALTGRELVVAEQLRQRGQYRVVVARDADIRATDQIVVAGTTYNVVWVPPREALRLDMLAGLEEA